MLAEKEAMLVSGCFSTLKDKPNYMLNHIS